MEDFDDLWDFFNYEDDVEEEYYTGLYIYKCMGCGTPLESEIEIDTNLDRCYKCRDKYSFINHEIGE